MWIDLVDFYGRVMSLETAIAQVRTDYRQSLDAELCESSTGSFSFSHAVCIVDKHGNHYQKSDAIEELAGNLLAEYGRARGGEPSDLNYEQWDFGRCRGWAMSYVGGPCEPEFEPRLKEAPCLPGQTLRNREERYVFVPKSASGDLPVGAKLAQEEFPLCWSCGSTRGFCPQGLNGNDQIISLTRIRRARDLVILCGICSWPLDPQPPK